MTTYLGKRCSFGLPRVPFVNCRQFMYLVISLLVLRVGFGVWLYQFLIIAYLFTLYNFPTVMELWIRNVYIDLHGRQSKQNVTCSLTCFWHRLRFVFLLILIPFTIRLGPLQHLKSQNLDRNRENPYFEQRIRIRIVYWWNAETTITHQDLWLGN